MAEQQGVVLDTLPGDGDVTSCGDDPDAPVWLPDFQDKGAGGWADEVIKLPMVAFT
jgi:hypothetical protein